MRFSLGQTGKSEGLVAVDWGTTNRRIFLLGPGGALEAREEDDQGITAFAPADFPAAIAALSARFGRPLLLAGMIGARGGWRETPYLPCPAGLAELAGALLEAEPDIFLVPGLAMTGPGEADVMRGEEVQALGALAGVLAPADALLCHPGTHAKWVVAEAGGIARFRTLMTGELFGLLKSHSLLAGQLQGEIAASDAFRAGAEAGLAGADLLHDLFALRARHLLGRGRDDAAFASGLLIGSDVRSGLALHARGPVFLVGRPDLAALYRIALALAGHESVMIDGEEAFLAGIRALAELN